MIPINLGLVRQIAEVGRFDEMVIETDVLRLLFVRFRAVAGHGNQHDIAEIRFVLKPLSDFISVDSWQADVQQDDVGVTIIGRRTTNSLP